MEMDYNQLRERLHGVDNQIQTMEWDKARNQFNLNKVAYLEKLNAEKERITQMMTQIEDSESSSVKKEE